MNKIPVFQFVKSNMVHYNLMIDYLQRENIVYPKMGNKSDLELEAKFTYLSTMYGETLAEISKLIAEYKSALNNDNIVRPNTTIPKQNNKSTISINELVLKRFLEFKKFYSSTKKIICTFDPKAIKITSIIILEIDQREEKVSNIKSHEHNHKYVIEKFHIDVDYMLNLDSKLNLYINVASFIKDQNYTLSDPGALIYQFGRTPYNQSQINTLELMLKEIPSNYYSDYVFCKSYGPSNSNMINIDWAILETLMKDIEKFYNFEALSKKRNMDVEKNNKQIDDEGKKNPGAKNKKKLELCTIGNNRSVTTINNDGNIVYTLYRDLEYGNNPSPISGRDKENKINY